MTGRQAHRHRHVVCIERHAHASVHRHARAHFALMLNLLCLIGALSALNATLTLPGIAGIVLTIGMGVDSICANAPDVVIETLQRR